MISLIEWWEWLTMRLAIFDNFDISIASGPQTSLVWSAIAVVAVVLAIVIFITSRIPVTEFANPYNGYVEKSFSSTSWLWVLLIGPLYWVARGVWRHALLHFVLIGMSFGLASLIYPFFTYRILDLHYRKSGWKEV